MVIQPHASSTCFQQCPPSYYWPNFNAVSEELHTVGQELMPSFCTGIELLLRLKYVRLWVRHQPCLSGISSPPLPNQTFHSQSSSYCVVTRDKRIQTFLYLITICSALHQKPKSRSSVILIVHYNKCIYRVIQEESAILWEMVVCVILSKKVRMNMGPILNGYRDMVKRRYGPSCEHEQQLRNK